MRLRPSWFLAVLAVLIAAGSAEATTYKVKRLSYVNLGAYMARVYLRWNMGKKNCEVRISGQLAFSKTTVVHLHDADGFNFTGATMKAACLVDGAIPQGTEVWLKYRIKEGETKSCRRNKSPKFAYYSDGTAVRFDSGGETLTNNRCRIFTDLKDKSNFILP